MRQKVLIFTFILNYVLTYLLTSLGMVINHADELLVPINNRLEEDDFEDVSGIDGALDALR